MNTIQHAPASEHTFVQFLIHNRRNRIILYGAAAAIVVQFIIFKYLYPFANYIRDDSFAYLDAALDNMTIATYPIGYSKFLRLISVFAKPDWALVSLQYVMIQCSTLFFLFSLFYFYQVSRVTQNILLCFMVFNPLFLHMGNMVSSDGLFLALSTTWFALLLWIIYKPSYKIIGWHTLVLFAAFTVRYNALIYPFISLLAFGLSKLPLRKKVLGLGLALLLIGWFVGLSMFQYKKLTGHYQFSPFSGWQLANNAMYAYRKVDSAARKSVPLKFQALDKMNRRMYDRYPYLPVGEAGTYYMWAPSLPLMVYKENLFPKDTTTTEFKKWATMGPLYSSYGLLLIKNYPIHYLRHFAAPNSLNYFFPPVEFLGKYNGYKTTVLESAVKWFGYKNDQVKTRMKSGTVWILQYYPFLVSITNFILFLMFLTYLLMKGWENNRIFNKIIFLAGFVWLGNAAFTILSAPVALRFQAFPILISVTFSVLLIDWMGRLMQHMKLQNQKQSLAI